ncbi:MAG: rhodanese-like domain-containing protein [bacterium]
MGFIKEILGGAIIIAIAGLIGLAQNMVRDDSITLVPTAARAVVTDTLTPQAEVKPSLATPTGEGMDDPWPTDAELASGEVTKDRLRTLMAAGSVTVIDARSPAEYEAGSIAGAINVPYDKLPDHYEDLKAKLPLDAIIVCYCQSVTCDQSENLAKELSFMGYANVLIYKGGWEEWETTGYPVKTPSVE